MYPPDFSFGLTHFLRALGALRRDLTFAAVFSRCMNTECLLATLNLFYLKSETGALSMASLLQHRFMFGRSRKHVTGR